MELTEELRVQLTDWLIWRFPDILRELKGLKKLTRPKYIIIDGKTCMPTNILSDPESKKTIVNYFSLVDFDHFVVEYDGEFSFKRW